MNTRIRVLFCIGSLSGGGAERQVVGTLRGLDRSRFEPHLYLTYRTGELLPEVPEDVPIHAYSTGIAGPRTRMPGISFYRRIMHLCRVIQQERPNVMYARTCQVAQDVFLAARKTGVPWIAVESSDPRFGFADHTPRFQFIKRLVVKSAYRHANRVVAVSHGVSEGIVAFYGIQPDHIVTILNFLDLERIDSLSREPVELPGSRFNVVFAGRLHRAKGALYLLEAVRELVHSRVRLNLLVHILGTGPEEPLLKAYVHENDLSGHVTFHGYVDNPYPYFRECQLFCLPSLYEGMPNALLEAMACHAPVLATDCQSGPREIIGNDQFGKLVPPADPEALADAMEDAMGHYEEWRGKTAAARAHIEENYSPASGIERLQSLLMEVVAEH